MRVALVGCGGVSRAHALALAAVSGTEPVVMVDLVEERAKEIAQQAGPDVRWSSDIHAVLSDPQIDAVGVLLPNHLHASVTLAALRQGKHVLVEKPMALTLADCAEMIQEAESRGLHLAVGQVLRFRNAYSFSRRAIVAGEIGRPLHSIRRRYARRGTAPQRAWDHDQQTSGGLLYGNGSHEIDAMLWLVDERPVEVCARGVSLGREGEERRGPSELVIMVYTDQGGILTLTMSQGMSRSAWDQWVVGTKGDLYLSGGEVTINGVTHDQPMHSGEDFSAEWDDFSRAIQENRPSAASARSVWGTMVTLECAKLSIRSGKQVKVEEVDRWGLGEEKLGNRD